MNPGANKGSKAAQPQSKAKAAAKNVKQGKQIKKHRIHYQVRFHRASPLVLARKPKYAV